MHTQEAASEPDQLVDVREGWTELPAEEIPAWNARLFNTDACYWQYPFFVEHYRSAAIQPRYLVWNNAREYQTYICILSTGLTPLRIGVVLRGPVCTDPNELIVTEALRDFYEWAKKNGYVLVRFTHHDADLLDQIASLGPSERYDNFPLFKDAGNAEGELIVDQLPDDAQMLAGFTHEARRKIRRASEAGYKFECADSPESLERVWHLFKACSKRKGFLLHQSLDSYSHMVREARPFGAVRIYTACHAGGKPVEALLVFRDRCTAFCFLAALDIDALNGKPTPSVLLHWIAMRDLFRAGCIYYNFGPGAGSVGRFKEQFAPRHMQYPSPVTLITNPSLYRWWKAILPTVRRGWPFAKRMLFGVH